MMMTQPPSFGGGLPFDVLPFILRVAVLSRRRLGGTPGKTAAGPCPDLEIDAGWSSPVARQAHNLEVVGSNPTPATNIQSDFYRFSKFQENVCEHFKKMSVSAPCPAVCLDQPAASFSKSNVKHLCFGIGATCGQIESNDSIWCKSINPSKRFSAEGDHRQT